MPGPLVFRLIIVDANDLVVKKQALDKVLKGGNVPLGRVAAASFNAAPAGAALRSMRRYQLAHNSCNIGFVFALRALKFADNQSRVTR